MARRTFFSFHYTPDVWRAWNVRKCLVVKPESQFADGFFDSSVFEASKKESEDSLKKFLRDGLKNSSVTCVLAGTETHERRWVRYEVVRSILKGNGLLTVDVHDIKDMNSKTSTRGVDPLACIGLYRSNYKIYFAEKNGEKWEKYRDYTLPLAVGEVWLPAPTSNVVVPLSAHCRRYNFVADEGRTKISEWIEVAAKEAGR